MGIPKKNVLKTSYACLCLVALLAQSIVSLSGQTYLNRSIDTTLLDLYTGRLEYRYFVDSAGNEILDGPLHFLSNETDLPESRKILLHRLEVTGSYQHGVKHGKWEVEVSAFHLSHLNLNKGRQAQISYRLNGQEETFLMNFEHGKRHGKWMIETRPVANGIYERVTSTTELNFTLDTLKGALRASQIHEKGGLVSVSGDLKGDGFLDGILQLVYQLNDQEIFEQRRYENGFLLGLVAREAETGKLVEEVTFFDVIRFLEELTDDSIRPSFTPSDQGFGIEFSNGYRSNEPEIYSQQTGNKVFMDLVTLFEPYVTFLDSLASPPVMLLTRRFRFSYPAYEDSLLKKLQHELEILAEGVDLLLAKPEVKIRNEKSDSVAYIVAWGNLVLEKLSLIDEVLDRIESGQFEYVDRSRYYRNGILGINHFNTLEYKVNDQIKQHIHPIPKVINHPVNLLRTIEDYFKILRQEIELRDILLSERMLRYDHQDKLDSLQFAIEEKRRTVESLYQPVKEYRNKSTNGKEIPFAYKLYLSAEERLLKSHFKALTDESMQFEDLQSTGKELLCLLEALEENKSLFDRIGSLPQYWNDSLFTQYQDNPFDTRRFESKILSATQQASTTLLVYFANNLLNARNCDHLIEEIENIGKLERRVQYYTENSRDDQVQLLERSLQRERVPTRIKRIMNI